MIKDLLDFQKVIEDIIGNGEFILRNADNKEAERTFLDWAINISSILEEASPNSILKYKVKQSMRQDFLNVNSIMKAELKPKLFRMLNTLRQIKTLTQEQINTDTNQEIKSNEDYVKIKSGVLLNTTFDNYTLGNQIGQGGNATVYKATNSDKLDYAIKILKPNLPLDKTKRFKNEISFCQKAEHSGIINVIDHGFAQTEHGLVLFYVMPLYKSTFKEFMVKETSPEKKKMALFSLLDALEYAHLKDCYHRDLKPQNILVDPPNNKYVISDFGIAHFEEEDILTAVETQMADRLANFQYAAPEQRSRGSLVSHLADIYAFGLIINETFTGQIPAGSDFTKISNTVPELSYLDVIVDKCIKQNPGNRFQSVAEIKEEIYRLSQVYLSAQKLDSITKEVITEDDVSNDPLISDPVKIISFDHDQGKFICETNHHIPELWIKLFRHGSHTWTSMHNFNQVQFNRKWIIYPTPIDYVPQLKPYLDQWIATTNSDYANYKKKEVANAVVQKKKELAEMAVMERKKAEILGKIKV